MNCYEQLLELGVEPEKIHDVLKDCASMNKEKISDDLGYAMEEVDASLDHLFSLFSKLGEDGVLFKTRKGYFLDTSMVPSDVSEALEGVMEAKYLFAGEYLTPYEWAQERRKELISLL